MTAIAEYTHTDGVMGLWLLTPRVFTHENKTYYVLASYGAAGEMGFAIFDNVAGTWSWSNDIGWAVQDDRDPHSSPTMNIDQDGYFIVVNGSYKGGLGDVICKNTDTVDSVASWNNLSTIQAGSTSNNTSYPTIFFKPGADKKVAAIYTYRSSSSPYNRTYFTRFTNAQAASQNYSWSSGVATLRGLSSTSWCYQQNIMTSTGRVYIIWHMLTGVTNRNLFCMYTDDIWTATPAWYSLETTPQVVSLPAQEPSDAQFVDSSAYASVDWDQCYIGAVGLDEDENPHCVFVLVDSTTTNRLMHGKWVPTVGWSLSTIVSSNYIGTQAGTTATAVCDADIRVVDNDKIAVITTQDNGSGLCHIYEYVSINGGTDWDSGTKLSADDSNEHTCPVYPRGVDATTCRALWFTGATANYTESKSINGWAGESEAFESVSGGAAQYYYSQQ